MKENLLKSLEELKSSCIGLFMPRYSKVFELVVKDDNNYLLCYHITNLGALHTLSIDASQGRYIKFPEGKSLAGMTADSTHFYNWCKENNI